MDINSKYREVEAWLAQLFAASQVPAYEKNHRTVELLYQLMLKNQARDRDVQQHIQDLQHKAVEYTAEGQRLGGILSALQLNTGTLSQSGITSLRTLANVAIFLQIKDASETSFLVALQHLQEEEDEVTEEHIMEKRLMAQLSVKTRDALVKQNCLLQACQQLEEQAGPQKTEMETRAKTCGFLQSKAKEYTQLILKLKETLSRSGVDPSVFHDTLSKKSKDLEKLKEEIEPLKKKLKNFHDLPPDISQAKVKVAELSKEVASLEADLAEKIDSMRL